MTRDDIIRMAKKAGAFPELSETPEKDVAFLERFAKAIEQHLYYDGIHTCHDECQRPACVAGRERVARAVEPLQARIADLYRQLDEAEKRLDGQYKLGMETGREACAKLCDNWPKGRDDVYSIGEAIRARGET